MSRFVNSFSKTKIPSTVLVNRTSTAIDSISLFYLCIDKGGKPKTGLPPLYSFRYCLWRCPHKPIDGHIERNPLFSRCLKDFIKTLLIPPIKCCFYNWNYYLSVQESNLVEICGSYRGQSKSIKISKIKFISTSCIPYRSNLTICEVVKI